MRKQEIRLAGEHRQIEISPSSITGVEKLLNRVMEFRRSRQEADILYKIYGERRSIKPNSFASRHCTPAAVVEFHPPNSPPRVFQRDVALSIDGLDICFQRYE